MDNNLLNNLKESFRAGVQHYATLTNQEWAVLASKLSYRQLKKGEPLISTGEVCDKIWLITRGLIRYFQHDVDLNEKTTCFAKEGDFITSFASYLNNTPSHECLIALEETEVVALDKAEFEFLLKTIPGISSLYTKVLEQAYLHMENLNHILQHYPALKRYKKLILQDNPELLQRVPLVYLASYIGISPETLSRIRRKI